MLIWQSDQLTRYRYPGRLDPIPSTFRRIMAPQAAKRRALGRDLFLIVSLASLTTLLTLFLYFDWGRGVARFYILMATTAGAAGVYWLVPVFRAPRPSRALVAVCGLSALIALGLNVRIGIRGTQSAFRTDTITLDQGQIVHRTLILLGQGISPHDEGTMVDPDELKLAYRRWIHTGCIETTITPGGIDQAVDHFWDRDLSVDVMRRLFPTAFVESERCRGARRDFTTRAYHYGPLLLLMHWPAMATLGPPGFYVTHWLWFAALLCALMLVVTPQRNPRSPWARWLPRCIALVIVLGPLHVARNSLAMSAVDLPAVCLALFGLFAYRRGRSGWAAFLWALSASTKLLPGLIFVPLLLRDPKRLITHFAVPWVLLNLPLALWSPSGFLHNVLLYPVSRTTDSTALSHFIGKPLRYTLLLGLLAGLAYVLRRVQKRGWRFESALGFLLLAHTGALATGSYFHNNYLVWYMPMIAVVCAVSVDRENAATA